MAPFAPILFNHRLLSLRLNLGMERWSECLLPGFGANYILCLEK